MYSAGYADKDYRGHDYKGQAHVTGDKHVLAVVEGATENTVVVQALLDNLVGRGLDPTVPRLFIVDGAKALSKAIRNTFGVAAAIQRCQVHKGRNIIERLPLHLHASVKKALRQAWDQDDADKAERLLRNLARRLEHEEPGVSGSVLEGLNEILTVIRLGLPHELRRWQNRQAMQRHEKFPAVLELDRWINPADQ